MSIECSFCGGQHPWWDCRKRPPDWRPPTKKPGAASPAAKGKGASRSPPVDAPDLSPSDGGLTHTTVEAKGAGRAALGASPAPAPARKKKPRKRGPGPFDKTAYQREYMRARRAAAKKPKRKK